MQYCVTNDGEHENEYGTLIVADLMSRTIFEWIENSETDHVDERNQNSTVLTVHRNASLYS